MTDTIKHLDDDAVVEVRITDTPRSPSVTGYGRKIPTRYMLKITHGRRQRWHRVYAMVYGNSGSTYVIKGGQELFLDTETEHRAELYAAGVERSPESTPPQPVRIDKLAAGDRFRFHADGVVSTLLAVENRSYRWQDYAGEHRAYVPGFADQPFWPLVFPTDWAQTEVNIPNEGVGVPTPLPQIAEGVSA